MQSLAMHAPNVLQEFFVVLFCFFVLCVCGPVKLFIFYKRQNLSGSTLVIRSLNARSCTQGPCLEDLYVISSPGRSSGLTSWALWAPPMEPGYLAGCLSVQSPN